MKVQILYQTQYAYAEAVSFSPHLFRLFPKAERHVRVLSSAFQTNAGAAVNYRRDLFDNEIASCFYPEKSAFLQAGFQLDLVVEQKNAFGFLVAPHALDLPFQYAPDEQQVLGPYVSGAAKVDLPFWKPPATAWPTIEALVELNDAIHANLEYERREDGPPHPPAELLARGAGACRDFATLLAEVLRGLGIAARLASGYLCEFGDGDKVAEGAPHAWKEAYIPGAGWLGMDPTNGTFCDHHHLVAAVGLTPADIAPVAGRFYHPKSIPPATMHASLKIIPHADS